VGWTKLSFAEVRSAALLQAGRQSVDDAQQMMQDCLFGKAGADRSRGTISQDYIHINLLGVEKGSRARSEHLIPKTKEMADG
jgi:hypothetical protein